MIVVRLMGGLGNQLFQYALGRRLTLENDAELGFDLSLFNHPASPHDTPRTYRLHLYNTVGSPVTQDVMRQLIGRQSGPRIFRNISRLYFSHVRHTYFRERSLSFHPEVLEMKEPCYLDGYWQSESYFSTIRDVLLKDLTLKDMPDAGSQKIADEIRTRKSVSVHIRRGDYVTNPLTSRYHGTCTLDYYTQAVDRIKGMVRDPHFFFFSDDIDWVRRQFPICEDFTFVSRIDIEKEYLDLWLMNQCNHHIIANSSFSWWGAWLSTDPEKIVIAPKQWFSSAENAPKDNIPDGWIRM